MMSRYLARLPWALLSQSRILVNPMILLYIWIRWPYLDHLLPSVRSTLRQESQTIRSLWCFASRLLCCCSVLINTHFPGAISELLAISIPHTARHRWIFICLCVWTPPRRRKWNTISQSLLLRSPARLAFTCFRNFPVSSLTGMSWSDYRVLGVQQPSQFIALRTRLLWCRKNS